MEECPCIPELEYWYTANNGNNEWRSPLSERDKVYWHIKRDQKHYHCINNVFEIGESSRTNCYDELSLILTKLCNMY